MKIKYFIRGLGVGILATTIVLSVSNSHHTKKMSEEEIIAQAKQLGMMTKEEFEDKKLDDNLSQIKDSLDVPSTSPTTVVTELPETEKPEKKPTKEPDKETAASEPAKKLDSDNSNKKENDSKKDKDDKKDNKKEDAWSRTIHVKIESGMVSQTVAKYLYQKGIVGSASDFSKYLTETENSQKIRAGEYDIPLDATYAEIVDIITK